MRMKKKEKNIEQWSQLCEEGPLPPRGGAELDELLELDHALALRVLQLTLDLGERFSRLGLESFLPAHPHCLELLLPQSFLGLGLAFAHTGDIPNLAFAHRKLVPQSTLPLELAAVLPRLLRKCQASPCRALVLETHIAQSWTGDELD